MIREIINKLNRKKQQLNNYQVENNVVEMKPIQKEIDIKISKQDNIYKIEISDYISIIDFINKKNSNDEFKILDLLCNYVLWNGRKQKVNKGIYYIIKLDNCIYNILFTDGIIDIDERIQKEIDEQTQKENITQERVITFDINKDEYHYFSAKHESDGNTYYTKFYDKDERNSFGSLDLIKEEAYEEMESVISNLESIIGIENIIDIQFLKENILKDLSTSFQKKK